MGFLDVLGVQNRKEKLMRIATCLAMVSLGTAAWQGGSAAGGRIAVRVDPRVELMSLIFRLAGNDEYNQPNSRSPYSEDIEAHFGEFRNHPAIKAARDLRNRRGVAFDAVMSMAMHIKDTVALEEKIPFDKKPPRLDSRWRVREARGFLDKARDFVKASRFNAFVADHKDYYERSAARLRDRIEQHAYIDWLDSFVGPRPGATFHAIPGLLNGGGSYGVGIRFPNGTEEISSVIGVWDFDTDGVPVFPKRIAGTITHEFCHSYTNPLVDAFAEQLEPAGKKIYPHCATDMKRQAYGNWKTMMRESLVRACTVRSALHHDGPDAARRAIAYQHSRGFRWVGELSGLLGEYEATRDRYVTLEAFMPKVVAFFNEYADRDLESLLAPRFEPMTLEAFMPKVVAFFNEYADRNLESVLASRLGPINSVFTGFRSADRMLVVMPDRIVDKDLAQRVERYVGEIHERFFADKGVRLVTASEVTEANLKDKAFVLYGSPASNRVLRDMAAKCRFTITHDHITIGGKRFAGRDLVLITCYVNPYNEKLRVLFYTSADDAQVINLNDFFHGPTEYLVGRWGPDGKPVTLHQGDYTRTTDGKWIIAAR